MEFLMSVSGSDLPGIRVYPIKTEEYLMKGTVVTFKDGFVERATDEDEVFGLLADSYDPERNEFNPNSGSGRVRVMISPDGIYDICSKCFYGNESCTNTTVVIDDALLPEGVDHLKGGYITLFLKDDASKNTDKAGAPRRILSSNGNVLTVEEGGIPEPGDCYVLVPPIGYDALKLSEKSVYYELSDNTGGKAKIVWSDPVSGRCQVMFKKTFFNN